MRSIEVLQSELDTILADLESIYAPLFDSDEYHVESIEEVVSNAFSYLDTFEDEQLSCDEMNDSANTSMCSLSLIVHMSAYAGLRLVDFVDFPNIISLSRFVFKLTRQAFAPALSLEEYRSFVRLMSYIDEERTEFKFGLPYRILKLMFLMVLYKGFSNASILAKFVLYQIALLSNINV